MNIKAIQKQFGTRPITSLKSFPFLDNKTRRYCTDILKMELITPLNYIDYNYDEVKKRIKTELDWRDYGGKHFESIWTRFYQGYILPKKFNIDKRKAHLSNLIYSGQMEKDNAIAILSNPSYNTMDVLQDDMEFVIKKFGLTERSFSKIMLTPRIEHDHFETVQGFFVKYPALRFLRPLSAILRK